MIGFSMLCSDVVFVYHVLHGLVKVDNAELGLSLSTLSTRGHNMNIVMKRLTSKYVSRAFNYRLAKLWNSMSNECKQVSSMYCLKKNWLKCSGVHELILVLFNNYTFFSLGGDVNGSIWALISFSPNFIVNKFYLSIYVEC